MNALTQVWLASGAKQERERCVELVESLKTVRRPRWLTDAQAMDGCWDEAIDAAVKMIAQKL